MRYSVPLLRGVLDLPSKVIPTFVWHLIRCTLVYLLNTFDKKSCILILDVELGFNWLQLIWVTRSVFQQFQSSLTHLIPACLQASPCIWVVMFVNKESASWSVNQSSFKTFVSSSAKSSASLSNRLITLLLSSVTEIFCDFPLALSSAFGSVGVPLFRHRKRSSLKFNLLKIHKTNLRAGKS